jgi:hypothetical protein
LAGYVVHSHPREADLPALLAQLCNAGVEFIFVGGLRRTSRLASIAQ